MIRTIALGLLLALASMQVNAELPESFEPLLDGRDFRNLSVSPTGEYFSVVQKRDGRNTLIILSRETMQPVQSVRYEESDNIEVSYGYWIDDELYAYAVLTEINEGQRPQDVGDLFLLDVATGDNERIWYYQGNYEDNARGRGDLIRGGMQVLSSLPDDPNNILVSIMPWEKADGGVRPSIYRLELATGDMKKMVTGPARGAAFLTNREATKAFSWAVTPDYETRYFHRGRNERWAEIDVDLPGGFYAQSVTADGDFVFGMSQIGDDLNAPQQLVKIALQTGAVTVEDEFGFVSSVDINYDRDGYPEFAQWVADKPEFKMYQETKAARIVGGFVRSFEGYSVTLSGADDNSENFTIHVGSPGINGEYYVWEADKGQARFLVGSADAIDQLGLNSFEAINYESSDGVQLQGWLLMPRSGEPKGLVNYIHGGPHGPYIPFGFDGRMHMMSELGYAVFAPNFRGSGGYGLNFEEAGYLQWGTRMLDDMREGAEFVQANYEVGDKVYIMGGSYGGYASAQSIVRHNDYYDCSVIIAGVFDLAQQLETWDAGSGFNTGGYENKAIGSDPEFLRTNSPIHNLDKINVPFMIVHGREDTRTPMVGAETMIEALEQTDLDYEYYFYDKEGHGLYFKENRLDQYEKVQAFLQRCDALD
ncbi:MAG: prolyl oligopeptidase family serine peptidase [Pseudomonadales bacterium]